jgi:hypothetical protein
VAQVVIVRRKVLPSPGMLVPLTTLCLPTPDLLEVMVE